MDSEQRAHEWRDAIDLEHPCFHDHAELIRKLDAHRFPNCEDLNPLLASPFPGGRTPPIRFSESDPLSAMDYERRIHEQGLISTRSENWHDLFNALSWAALPCIKSAMNQLHCRPRCGVEPGTRGSVRDAVTLLDECGMIVLSPDRKWLHALACQDWRHVFPEVWRHPRRYRFIVVGHALLESMLTPYKSLTAQALPLEVAPTDMPERTNGARVELDRTIARGLLNETLLQSTADLTPLPVMGLPGWWTAEPQDADFYRDPRVFRPRREGRQPAAFRKLMP